MLVARSVRTCAPANPAALFAMTKRARAIKRCREWTLLVIQEPMTLTYDLLNAVMTSAPTNKTARDVP